MRDRFSGDLLITAKGDRGDLVTDLDHEAERVIIDCITETFPEHRIISEECGEIAGSAEWTWLLDPLDGTNNVALGLPLFGVCVTLCHRGIPIIAAVYSGHQDATYVAVRGHGVVKDETTPVRIVGSVEPCRTTVSWIQGYGVRPDDPVPHRALSGLHGKFKRILQLWAPTVDWALLVEGRIGAVVCYRNEAEDLMGGILAAVEAGAVLTDFSGRAVADPAQVSGLVVAVPSALDPVVAALAGPYS
ncbi:MAG: inositol monophosphatase [Actinomycetota bacterium]|nr:inositol monophosphatase [Actinomycetota bacterium]